VEQVKPVRFSAFLESVYNGSITAEDVVVEPKLVKPDLPLGGDNLFRRWEQVGSREQTSSKCQDFLFLSGCSRTELHDKIVEGVSWKGKNYMKPVFNSCDKPTCCKCKDSWASRQATKAKVRLVAAAARYGVKLEHVIVSLSPADYGLPYDGMKEKVRKGLELRGWILGAMAPHAFRGKKIFREGFHFHVMAAHREGYDRCRVCTKWDCSECDGIRGVSIRARKEKDGLMVKVLEERRTIGGTLAYELNHASVLKGAARFHVLTYFGLCSYNNMGHVEDEKLLCAVCASELTRHNYIGVLPMDAFKRKGKIEERMYDAEEDGKEVFIPYCYGNSSSVVKPNPYKDGGSVAPRSGG